MEALFPFGAALVGFVLGAFAFSRVGHWLVGIHGSVGRGTGALLSAVFLASGPWVLVALGLVSVKVASATWAWWSFGGFAVAIALFAALSVYSWRKARQREREHAA
jgi:hypothetical protein